MRDVAHTAGDDDTIVGAVAGHHRVVTPSDDNAQTAAASDLRGLDEGGEVEEST